ncbi:MAG TPA: SdiA-regulated domain-containing protein [Vicinamibacteria bacterium]|nr:SdiA-regulated domain-containing protein [Vicinamibacteria bacterium]
MVEDEPAGPVAADPDEREEKRRRKDAKLRAQSTRSMSPWERYRALVDSLEEAQDLVELADRKARFALVIMGALNVAFFFLATRSDVADYLPQWLRPFLGFYLLLYAAVALFFFLEAIEALRPRRFKPQLPYPGEGGPEHYPEGVRYYEDIIRRDLEAYRRAWREVRFGQLNAELAVQNHIMAHINLDKYSSLRRLYGGLRVLTLLAGGLLAALALSMLFHRPSGLAAAAPLPSSSAAGPLGVPQIVPVAGLREASGIAWHPARRSFFVVGDRGTLAEIRSTGAVVATHHVRGNLEDVAVHGPSGRLVLLAEKKGEIVVWDPGTAAETARFPLDVAGILGREPADRNQGFEGIVFRAEAGHPGGGVFHLVHQRKPARLVTIAFDPAGPERPLGAGDVLARHGLKPHADLTAVAWSDALGRLLVIAESDDRLLVVSPDGAIDAAVALPGGQQEGLALDPEGALWVADERLGVLRLPGAGSVLAAALAAGEEGGDE